MKAPSLRERTHHCNALGTQDIGSTATLMGWIGSKRDKGGALFFDLRDRYGVTQVVFDASKDRALLERAGQIRPEDVVAIKGQVVARLKANDKLPTGAVEVVATDLHIYSKAQVPPFPVRDTINAGTETRLKYRYLDLRRPSMQRTMVRRAQISHEIRNLLFEDGFLEIETPFMVKYTPGGARNFMVPSRLHKGNVYALAESPQIYKQLLMVAGYDRYYQLAKCFRDEDPRQDRQLEFTQIDLEMSFADQEDVLRTVEGLFTKLFERLHLPFTQTPFPQLTWDEAMARYGTDKPDTRFGLEHVLVTDFARTSGVGILASLSPGMLVKAMVVPGVAKSFSRKKMDELTSFVKREEVGPAKGLIWLKVEENHVLKGPIAKFLTPEKQRELIELVGANPQDVIFIVSGEQKLTHRVMDFLRRELASWLNLVDSSLFAPLWILNFPMFERNENNEWTSSHHPFTHPRLEDLPLLGTPRQGEVKSIAYDLVINGNEVGGGSVRIHDPEIQSRVFAALGITEADAKALFGFLLEAFTYGVPPHAGFAAGLDRLIMIITGTDSLRDVIAFPKTVSGLDAMTGAPTPPAPSHLAEAGMALLNKNATPKEH